MLLRRARDWTDVSARRDLGAFGFQAVDGMGRERDLRLAGGGDEHALLEQALQGDSLTIRRGLEPVVIELAAGGGDKQSGGEVREAAATRTNAVQCLLLVCGKVLGGRADRALLPGC